MRAFDAMLVRKAMKMRAISQAQLARNLGFTSQSAVSALLAGKRRVTVDEAAAIYALLGLDQAAQAVSDIARPTEPASARLRDSGANQDIPDYGPDYGPDYRVVPVIGIAGAGRWREAVEMPLGHMPVPGRLSGRGVFGIEVNGDSMDLLIEDGGLILVDAGQKELAAGGVYLIANSGGPQAGRCAVSILNPNDPAVAGMMKQHPAFYAAPDYPSPSVLPENPP